ncbi:MAG: NAD(P)H-dependent oxidoreductase subunit E [bacterium]
MDKLILRLTEEAKGRQGSLFYILNGINKELGYIPEEALLQTAENLNISKAEVYGFLSFFRNYKTDAEVGYIYRKIVVCRSESCEASGSKQLIEHIKASLNLDFGKYSPDGKYFLDYVYCFGHCAASPAVEVDGILYEKVNPEVFDKIIKTFDSNKLEEPAELKATDVVKKEAPVKSLIFKRCGYINTLSVSDYLNNDDGFKTLRRVIEEIKSKGDEGKLLLINELKQSKLRGRGGAGFPAGIKWETVFKEKSDVKYIICNADEGDSGAYADRMILESDPVSVIEGMIIAGLITSSDYGCIYLRAEYAAAKSIIESVLALLKDGGYLGNDILGSGFKFNIDLITGAGSYVCGEETALMESIENKRATVRQRPPVPAVSGLYGKPTVINNVLTFAYAVYILKGNSNLEYFLSLGTENSKGTMPFQVSGAVKNPGIFEIPFGVTLKELLELAEADVNAKAVQVGGPLGAYFPLSKEFLDLNLSYEGVSMKNGLLGHGGVVVFGGETDFKYRLLNALDFFIDESCGKCAPCRIGTVRLKELFERVLKKQNAEENLKIIDEIIDSMKYLSLCAFGAGVHMPVKSLLTYFKNEII